MSECRRPSPSPPLQTRHDFARALTKTDLEVAQAPFFQSSHTDNYDPNVSPICTLFSLLYDLLSTFLLHLTFKGLVHIDIDIIFAIIFRIIVSSSATLRLALQNFGSTVHVPLYHTLAVSGGFEKYGNTPRYILMATTLDNECRTNLETRYAEISGHRTGDPPAIRHVMTS